MQDPGFYNLVSGSIGKVYYQYTMEKTIAQETEEKIQNKNASAYVNKLIHDLTFNPQNVKSLNAYEVSRKDTTKMIDGYKKSVEVGEVYLQIGQKQSYDSILEIENDPEFIAWSEPYFISLVKEFYVNSI